MTRKFPSTVRLTIGRTNADALAKLPAYQWEVHTRADGGYLADGSATSRDDAREQAWRALEQVGLVVDE